MVWLERGAQDQLQPGVPITVPSSVEGRWTFDPRCAGRPMLTATTYDRIPAGAAEIRRASEDVSVDGHVIGHVDGFLVDPNDGITP